MRPSGKGGSSCMIIVSGFPRSGTSMMMKILEKGGLKPIKDNIKIKESNPNGCYETVGITTYPPDWRIDSKEGNCRKIVAPHIMRMKGSYPIIYMTRDLDEVIASFAKLITDTLKVKSSPAKWAYKYLLGIMKGWLKDKNVIYMDYNKIMENPEKELEKLKDLLPNFEEAVKVVDPKLYRNRKCDLV